MIYLIYTYLNVKSHLLNVLTKRNVISANNVEYIALNYEQLLESYNTLIIKK